MPAKYNTNPQEVYTLELNKLQRSYSEVARLGEEASEVKRVDWRKVWYLRQFNFMLVQAVQVGEMLLKIGY
jgi:hypothetical protein